jgi:hypothetical protein
VYCSINRATTALLLLLIITALMMEVVTTSETSVSYEPTRRYIPEGCHLHTHSRENLKGHICQVVYRQMTRQAFDKAIERERNQSWIPQIKILAFSLKAKRKLRAFNLGKKRPVGDLNPISHKYKVAALRLHQTCSIE